MVLSCAIHIYCWLFSLLVNYFVLHDYILTVLHIVLHSCFPSWCIRMQYYLHVSSINVYVLNSRKFVLTIILFSSLVMFSNMHLSYNCISLIQIKTLQCFCMIIYWQFYDITFDNTKLLGRRDPRRFYICWIISSLLYLFIICCILIKLLAYFKHLHSHKLG